MVLILGILTTLYNDQDLVKPSNSGLINHSGNEFFPAKRFLEWLGKREEERERKRERGGEEREPLIVLCEINSFLVVFALALAVAWTCPNSCYFQSVLADIY